MGQSTELEDARPMKEIGIIFMNDKHWTGGTDYIVNLINALNTLESENQPHLTVFTHQPQDQEVIVECSNYSRISYEIIDVRKKKGFLARLSYKIGILSEPAFPRALDLIYPMPEARVYRTYFRKTPVNQRVFWIPDFQEKHFPNLFDAESLVRRDNRRREILDNPRHRVVLSSQAAKEDLLRFYPQKRAQLEVLNFAVSPGENIDQNLQNTLAKYNLPSRYFLCPNQFWMHKNHLLILKAIKQLKEQKGLSVCVAFCGKENDPRNPEHAPNIKQRVKDENLEKELRFLGFLPKEDQITLLKGAQALIQPSLFEGWSTTIEDAMTYNKPVLASRLPVNIEQLNHHGYFFDLEDPRDLMELLARQDYPSEIDYQPLERVKMFAQTFIGLADRNKIN